MATAPKTTGASSTADASSAAPSMWRAHAQQWQHVGAPLRPGPEDAAHLAAMSAQFVKRASPTVLVMGVTPEIVSADWPADGHLVAIDHSQEMITKLWQPGPATRSSVHHARWQAMPVESESIHLIVGDAPTASIPKLSEYAGVLGEMKRVLAPGGAAVLRFFVRPPQQETLEAVRQDAMSNKIKSFHALKWRVAMALELNPEFNVAMSDVRAAFEACFPDRDALASTTGWARQSIDTIDAYKGASTVCSFPTMAAIETALAGFFTIHETQVGTYELADRCPTLLLKPLT